MGRCFQQGGQYTGNRQDRRASRDGVWLPCDPSREARDAHVGAGAASDEGRAPSVGFDCEAERVHGEGAPGHDYEAGASEGRHGGW
ncbi:hypothetical protein D3C84_1140540 [compost metagenome]